MPKWSKRGFNDSWAGVSIIVLLMILLFSGNLKRIVVMVFAIFNTASTLIPIFIS